MLAVGSPALKLAFLLGFGTSSRGGSRGSRGAMRPGEGHVASTAVLCFSLSVERWKRGQNAVRFLLLVIFCSP